MKNIYSIIILSCIFSFAKAQTTTFYSDLVYSPLLINNNAVTGGMGDINNQPDGFVMSLSDINTLLWQKYHNKKLDIGLSYTPWMRNLINDINCLNLNSRFKFEKNVIGISLNYLRYGEIIFTNEQGSYAGQDVPISYNIQMNFQRLLFKHLLLEYSPKYFYNEQIIVITNDVNNNIYPRKLLHYYNGNFLKGTAFASDIGLNYINNVKISQQSGIGQIGFKIYNLGTDLKHKTISYVVNQSRAEDYVEKLPTTLSITSAYTFIKNVSNNINYAFKIAYQYDRLLIPFKDDLTNNGEVIIASDTLSFVRYFNVRYVNGSYELRRHNPLHKFGFEFKKVNSEKPSFSLRIGYQFEENSFNNWNYFTVGAGFDTDTLYYDIRYVIASEVSPVRKTFSMTLGYCF